MSEKRKKKPFLKILWRLCNFQNFMLQYLSFSRSFRSFSICSERSMIRFPKNISNTPPYWFFFGSIGNYIIVYYMWSNLFTGFEGIIFQPLFTDFDLIPFTEKFRTAYEEEITWQNSWHETNCTSYYQHLIYFNYNAREKVSNSLW